MQVFCALLMWIICTLCYNFAKPRHVSCPFGSCRVLSFDDNLLARENLSATSSNLQSPAHYLISRCSAPVHVWCTEPDSGTVQHHVNLSFSQAVLIEQIISAGHNDGFVTNFSILYSPHWDGEFIAYSDPNVQQYFVVPHIDVVFDLSEPLVASRLRLLIHDGLPAPGNGLCWHLTFLGCPLSHVQDSSNLSYTSFNPSATPSLCPPTGAPHGPSLSVIVVGSLAAAIIITLLLILVVALYTYSHCHKYDSHQRNVGQNNAVSHISTLYDNPRSPTDSAHEANPYEVPQASPRHRRASLVDNPMYSTPFSHALISEEISMVHNQCYQMSESGKSAYVNVKEQPISKANADFAESSAEYDEVQ